MSVVLPSTWMPVKTKSPQEVRRFEVGGYQGGYATVEVGTRGSAIKSVEPLIERLGGRVGSTRSRPIEDDLPGIATLSYVGPHEQNEAALEGLGQREKMRRWWMTWGVAVADPEGETLVVGVTAPKQVIRRIQHEIQEVGSSIRLDGEPLKRSADLSPMDRQPWEWEDDTGSLWARERYPRWDEEGWVAGEAWSIELGKLSMTFPGEWRRVTPPDSRAVAMFEVGDSIDGEVGVGSVRVIAGETVQSVIEWISDEDWVTTWTGGVTTETPVPGMSTIAYGTREEGVAFPDERYPPENWMRCALVVQLRPSEVVLVRLDGPRQIVELEEDRWTQFVWDSELDGEAAAFASWFDVSADGFWEKLKK